ncbi:MAG TPA: hypothetical protein VKY32_07465 [Flavobacterium sp.]|nr:hypothetical protein [Flavobacterium sp.]
MYKNYFWNLLLFLSFSAFAQEDFALKGVVSSEEEALENIFVLNRNTDEMVQTNQNGEFDIQVKIGDKLVAFDANDYFVPNVFNIVSADESRLKHIELIPKAEELDELVIESQPTSKSLGITDIKIEQANPTQADIKGIVELIIGLFVNKNKTPEPPNFEQRQTWFEANIPREELTEKYQIPAEQTDLFYRFLAEDISLFNILQNNPKQAELELYEKSFRFLNTENERHEE